MKINLLTFYRFLAASIVVFFHYGRDTAFVSLAPGFLTAGPEMVSFFFVLSGFVMVIAYWNRTFDPPAYYRARLVRILPAYFLALIAALFLETVAYSKRTVVINALFLQAWIPPYPLSLNGPSWSLSVEMFFYLTFPLLLWFLKSVELRKTTLLVIATTVWLLTLAFLTYLMNSPLYEPYPSSISDLIFYFPLSHFATFLLGVTGGYAFLKWGQKAEYNRLFLGLGVMITIIALVASLNNKAAIEKFFHVSIPFAAGFFAPLFLLLIVLTAFLSQTTTNRFLNNKTFILLGNASYVIYIFQRPFHQFFEANIFPILGISGEPAFYVYFFCLILFSVAVFLYIEKPLKRTLRPGLMALKATKQI